MQTVYENTLEAKGLIFDIIKKSVFTRVIFKVNNEKMFNNWIKRKIERKK